MFINTEVLAKKEYERNYCTLFDTQTGFSYELNFSDDYVSPDNVGLHINAVTAGENANGLSYHGQEAIDFWRKFSAIVHGPDIAEWMAAKADLAQAALDAGTRPAEAQADNLVMVSRYDEDDLF